MTRSCFGGTIVRRGRGREGEREGGERENRKVEKTRRRWQTQLLHIQLVIGVRRKLVCWSGLFVCVYACACVHVYVCVCVIQVLSILLYMNLSKVAHENAKQ